MGWQIVMVSFGAFTILMYELLKKHFIELRAVSPEGSTHVLDIPGLKVSSIKFWSLWKTNKLLGCGAIKFLENDHGDCMSKNLLRHIYNW